MRRTGVVFAFVVALAFVALAFGNAARAAPAPPAGPHPRIALSPALLAALKERAGVASSAAAEAIAFCRQAEPAPGMSSGYQGDGWAFPASACALAWQVTGDAALAARGVKLWRALLEDVEHLGDGKACVPGASRKQAIAAIERDTGYALRFIGPHAALAYDWLHEAPGVDEALRRQSRECFAAWLDWYTGQGYLRRQPGANYHAGYALAKTLIAVATGGEGGDASDRQWREVVDDVFGVQIVANGLAGAGGGLPRGPRNGVLVGGDWAEGWQYGPLSVLEYAFAARVLEEQHVPLAELHAWADDLTVRYLHGLVPGLGGMYVGGDTESDTPWVPASGGPLLATLLGPSSARAAGWAASLRLRLGVGRWGPPVFEALAEAHAVPPADPLAPPAGARPTWFLARGTRTVYARSAWDGGAFWTVFTSAPRLVDDHQHPDASNFVFARGADALVVDPSPYASRSTLTGNALTVDSDLVGDDYRPSQTFWSEADLPWARATRSGVVAARADLARAFAYNGKDSDVPLARRDWVFLPEGELVILDRAITGGPARHVSLRFRTPATLQLAAGAAAPAPTTWLARGTVGASAIAIHAVFSSPPTTPTVSVIPRSAACAGKAFGACAIARFPVNEYALALSGAEVRALHVIDGLGASEAPADVASFPGAVPPVGAAPAVLGARVTRGARVTFVVAAAASGAAPAELLAYDAPGAVTARHVVFDAPEDGQGRAGVTASATSDGRCHVALAATGMRLLPGRPVIMSVGPSAGGCVVTEDVDQPSDGAPHGASDDGAPDLPHAEPRARASGGCGCALSTTDVAAGGVSVAVALALGVLAVRRRRRGPRP